MKSPEETPVMMNSPLPDPSAQTPPPPIAPPPPPAPSHPQTARLPAPAVPTIEALPERDRIVILGRRQAGKTIYLASLYNALYRSYGDLTAEALSGTTHTYLTEVHQTLKSGQWPSSTLGTSRLELELTYRGEKHLLVTLDYAGELFARAFVHEQTNEPGVAELLHHIDRAAAVLLLVDPAVIAGAEHPAAVEDDFGVIQAIRRIRNWPGGEHVPIALVLTKADQNEELIRRHGGIKQFIVRHFAPMLRVLGEVKYFTVSAVQTSSDGADNGAVRRPRGDFKPRDVERPLRMCLDQIIDARVSSAAAAEQAQLAAAARRADAERVARERRTNMLLVGGIGTIIVLGVAALVFVMLNYR